MAGASFTTQGLIHIWRRSTMDPLGLPEPVTFDSRNIDIDARVTITPDEGSIQATLWNVGSPETVMPILRDGYLVAVDLTRISGASGVGDVPATRVALGRISARQVIESEEDGDIGFRFEAADAASVLQEIHIQGHFSAEDGPWRARDIAASIVKGLGFIQIEMPDDWYVDTFTADGPVYSVLRRLAGKAGRPMGVWTQGSKIVISPHFTPGHVISARHVLTAEPDDQVALVQPILPVLPPETQVVGEGYDYGSLIEDASEEMQVARSSAPAGNSYKLVLPLAPEIVRGEVLRVEGQEVLSRLNILGVQDQAFNVHGVTHIFSSRDDAAMDVTEVLVGTREEPA